jgi:hypothetical protein
MIGFRGTASMASAQAIQASCQAVRSPKVYIFHLVDVAAQFLSMPNIASLICATFKSCAPHNK